MSQSEVCVSAPLWKRVLFSDLMLSKSKAQKVAYIGVLAALNIIANTFLEIKFFDTQFSLTIFLALLTGILIGPLFGFAAVFLGDFVGYVCNSWGYLYMPWVGLSSATFAFLAGLICGGVRIGGKGGIYFKLALVCVVSFFVCTVAINSTGFYFYNKAAGFSTALIDYVTANFGGKVSYFAYVCYRLFFNGQIFNSLFNYALIFIAVPVLNAVRPLRLNIR